jgi:hypothetical protein
MRAHADVQVEPRSSGNGRRLRISAPPAIGTPLAWEAAEGHARSGAPADLVAYAASALAAEGLRLKDPPVLLRHGPGDHGLPPLAGGDGYAFAIDLTDARRTLDGGLLLFVDGDGRAEGWRAEAGALTLWRGADPVLTEMAPGAPQRLTLVGRATTV